MALIKCSECGSKISDQAETCPKCGFELNTRSKKTTDFKNNNSKYLIIIAILILGALLLFNNKSNIKNNNQDSTTTPSTNSGYKVYTNSTLKISFEYPNDYKVSTGNDGLIYLAKNIDNQGALVPYIVIGRYDNFNNAVQFLNSFTDYMKKEYNDLKITIDLVSGTIGNKLVYGLAYNYTSDNHLVVDNRYAIVENNVVYMIGSKEENVNTQEINNVVEHVITTFSIGG